MGILAKVKSKMPEVPASLFTYGAVVTYSYMFGSTAFLTVAVLKEVGYDLSKSMDKIMFLIATFFYFLGSFAGVLSRIYPEDSASAGVAVRYKPLRSSSPSPSPATKKTM
jgi:hypothetical protein